MSARSCASPVLSASFVVPKQRVGGNGIVRDLMSKVRCAHGSKLRRCIICRMKVNGNAFRQISEITHNTDQTQAILNIVYNEMLRLGAKL